jgi:hypothetical protein
MLSTYGKDYALHARGIYYRRYLSKDLTSADRQIWVPVVPEDGGQDMKLEQFYARSQIVVSHAQRNEKVYKSEYAWEADAWSDVFRDMRDDTCLGVYVLFSSPVKVPNNLYLAQRQISVRESSARHGRNYLSPHGKVNPRSAYTRCNVRTCDNDGPGRFTAHMGL